MRNNKSNYFTKQLSDLAQPQDMLEPGELLNAQGQPLNINNLDQDQRDQAGIALAAELRRFIPESNNEFTTMARSKFTSYGFNDEQRQTSLESMAAMVKLLKGLKGETQVDGVPVLSEPEFNKVKERLLPYANFACADGAVTKMQEMLYALKTSQSNGIEGVLYNAKVANISEYARQLVADKGMGPKKALFRTLGLQGGNAWEVHDKVYLDRLVSDVFQLQRSGDDDHYITEREERDQGGILSSRRASKQKAYLSYLDERFEEKQTAINIINNIADEFVGLKPLVPSENNLGNNYQQRVVADFMDSITNLKDKLGYRGELFEEVIKVDFPEGSTQEQIENFEVLPTKFSYKASADAIFRLAAINSGVQQGYLGGELKVFTCPSVKALIQDVSKYGINIDREFVDLSDITRSIESRMSDLDNSQKVNIHCKLANLSKEIEGLELDDAKKQELGASIASTRSRLGKAPQQVVIDLFENNSPETIARLLSSQLNAANGQEPNPQALPINSEALRTFCSPNVIQKMEKVAEIMTNREEGKYSKFGDLLNRFVNFINKCIGGGVNDEMLKDSITKMQQLTTAYNELGVPAPEQEQQLSFVEKLTRQRNQPEANINAPQL